MAPDKRSFDKRYSSEGYNFTFRPDKEIIKDILKLKKSGKVLDLGCGEGGNALALAEKGFEVTCMDISEIAIEKIKLEAEKRKLKINALTADLDSYAIKGEYDVVICLGILQFLREEGGKFVKEVIKNTKKEGINVVDAFVNKWLPAGKLDELYASLNLIEFEKYSSEEFGRKMVYLVAQKK